MLFAAPTAIRAIKKEDPAGAHRARYDLSPLRYLFLAGERLDPDTYHWASDCGRRRPPELQSVLRTRPVMQGETGR
jgi:acyl-coenzyme A synthetase/AMP-(fatty) acid ligase